MILIIENHTIECKGNAVPSSCLESIYDKLGYSDEDKEKLLYENKLINKI